MSVKDNTFGIAPIQDKMLSIFMNFKSICEQENLRYWAGTGTCLGAVRHHGFIPWDDDMDIYMPRGERNWRYLDKNTQFWNKLFKKELLDRVGLIELLETYGEYAPIVPMLCCECGQL